MTRMHLRRISQVFKGSTVEDDPKVTQRTRQPLPDFSPVNSDGVVEGFPGGSISPLLARPTQQTTRRQTVTLMETACAPGVSTESQDGGIRPMNHSPPRRARMVASFYGALPTPSTGDTTGEATKKEKKKAWVRLTGIMNSIMKRSDDRRTGPITSDIRQVRERLRELTAERSTRGGDKDPEIQHLRQFASLYVLRLVATLFGDSSQRSFWGVSEDATIPCPASAPLMWGGKRSQGAPYTRLADYLAAEVYNDKDNVEERIPSQTLPARLHLGLIVSECFATASQLGKAPTNSMEVRRAKRTSRWFLIQFCTIYNYAVLVLNQHQKDMCGTLELIATLPELQHLRYRNEDTLGALLQGQTFLSSRLSQKRRAQRKASTASRRRPGRSSSIASRTSISGPRRNGSVVRYSKDTRLSNRRSTRRKLTPSLMSPGMSGMEMSSGASSGMWSPETMGRRSGFGGIPLLTMGAGESSGYADTMSCLSGYATSLGIPGMVVGVNAAICYLAEFLTRSQRLHLTPAVIGRLLAAIGQLESTYSISMQLRTDTEQILDYLMGPEIHPKDLLVASHWLRESADQGSLKEMNQLGFSQYRIEMDIRTGRRNTYIDPRLAASHLKHLIWSIPGSLIPLAVREAVDQLLPKTTEEVEWLPEPEEISLLRYLLRLDADRESLIQGLFSLSGLILSGPKDQITPWGLAIVLPVAPLGDVLDLGMLKRWNWCWGCLLGRSEQLMEQDDVISRLSGWTSVMRLLNEASESGGRY